MRKVLDDVRLELKRCRLVIAEGENAIVASSEALARAVAEETGVPGARQGTAVKKLGADYTLDFYGREGPKAAARRRARHQQRAARPQARWRRIRAVARAPAKLRARGGAPGQGRVPAERRTRAERLAKASRRLRRLRVFRAGGLRLFNASVLPPSTSPGTPSTCGG